MIKVNASVIRLPSEIKKIIALLQKYTGTLISFYNLDAKEQLELLGAFDFFRRPHMVVECIDLLDLIVQGRDINNAPLRKGRDLILRYQSNLLANKIIVDTEQSGEEIKLSLYGERLNVLAKLKNRNS